MENIYLNCLESTKKRCLPIVEGLEKVDVGKWLENTEEELANWIIAKDGFYHPATFEDWIYFFKTCALENKLQKNGMVRGKKCGVF